MSWYFDTENWAAGIWNSWAEARTDTWREAMVRAVLAREGGRTRPTTFAVAPTGVTSEDFSFIVIGDTGEGDASQHVLRDQLLGVANQRRRALRRHFVGRRLSDRRDAGLRGEVLAAVQGGDEAGICHPRQPRLVRRPGSVRGNVSPGRRRAGEHARTSRGRPRVTSTTDERIEQLIAEAEPAAPFLWRADGISTRAVLRAPDRRFALIAIDTGVLSDRPGAGGVASSRAEPRGGQDRRWRSSATRSYAGGHDLTARRRAVRSPQAAAARDTASRSSWRATRTISSTTPSEAPRRGDGASLRQRRRRRLSELRDGARMARPAADGRLGVLSQPEAVSQKIDAETPWWKRPAWWWTRRFGAWPFSAEWLSAAFDYNVAPFFQSFVEVRVEPSANRVRLIPFGVHGRLAMGDVAVSESLRAGSSTSLEWIVPMPPVPAGGSPATGDSAMRHGSHEEEQSRRRRSAHSVVPRDRRGWPTEVPARASIDVPTR